MFGALYLVEVIIDIRKILKKYKKLLFLPYTEIASIKNEL